MTDALKDNLGGIFGDMDADAPVPEAEAERPVEAAPPADEPAVEPETQQPAEVPQETTDKGHVVPLATFLEQKFEARDAKKELEALRRQLAEAQAKPEPVVRPDPYEDPEGYDRYVQNQVAQVQWNTRAEISGRFAEQKYGKEMVEAAIAWAQEQGQADPTLGQRVQAQASPVEWVVEQYNRDQLYQRINADPNLLAQLTGAVQANPGAVAPQAAAPAFVPTAVTPKQAPPRSLATAPSSGALPQTAQNGDVFKSLKFNLD